jgi:hypothetical protein
MASLNKDFAERSYKMQRFGFAGVLVLLGVSLNGGFASAGCMVCSDGHVTCHDSGGHPNCMEAGSPESQGARAVSSSIVCGSGQNPAIIVFQQPILNLPLGQNPAQFKNIAFPLHDFAHISMNPVFHFRQVSVETAYCVYLIDVDGDSGNPYILQSYLTCEGQQSKIQCEIR